MLAEQETNDRGSIKRAKDVPDDLVRCTVPCRIDSPVHCNEMEVLSWAWKLEPRVEFDVSNMLTYVFLGTLVF